MKQVWTNDGHEYDCFNLAQAEGRWFLQHVTPVKNIWVPYGESSPVESCSLHRRIRQTRYKFFRTGQMHSVEVPSRCRLRGCFPAV